MVECDATISLRWRHDRHCDRRKTTFAELPARLEAGTPNYSGIITWGAALDYLMDIGIERMASYEEELIKKAEEVLEAIPQVNILGHPKQRQAVFPFRSMVCILTILQV